MLKKISSILFLFAFTCFFTPALNAQLHYENQVVEKIEVIFNTPSGTQIDSATVISRLKTKQGEIFSQADFDIDLKTLAQDYDRVEPIFDIAGERISITLKIWPKPTIRTICWKGNDRMETKELQNELKIPLCSVFDRQIFNTAFHKLKAYYITKGFFEAQLTYDLCYDSVTNEVDIEIQIIEGRAGRIKDICFINFTKEEKEDLLEMMVTKKYNLFTSWYTNEGIYNEEAVQHDQFIILNYLQNEGYADARLEIDVCEAKENNRIIIKLIALKGEPYYFGNLTLEGNTLFCDEDIWDLFTFSEEDPYSPEEIRETIQRIMDYYGRRGYIDAYVDFETKLSNDDCHAYDISFNIDEGEQYRVGLVQVFGNCSTQTNVILHETILIPGEIFNIDKLKLTEMRLQNIGYFENVNVYAVKSGAPCGLGGNYRDVHIEVEETSTGKFGAFFGFSTVENMFGGINISENNFNCEGLGRFWNDGYKALRGGGEFAHFTATIGAKSRSYVVSWTKPYFLDTPWVVGFDLENSTNRYISNAYTLDSSGINIHATYNLNIYLKAGLHYRLKYTDTVINKEQVVKKELENQAKKDAKAALDSKSSASEEPKPPIPTTKSALDNAGLSVSEVVEGPLLEEESKNDGLISAIGATLIYDSTNSPSCPSSGIKSRLEAEIAGIGGEYFFIGAAYLNNVYFQVSRKGILKLRGDFRFIFTYDGTHPSDLPLDERLYLGGDSIVRGYRPYRLGPQFADKQPRGGLSMQLLSIEYTHSFMKRLEGFLFCDSGHLSFHEFHFGRMSTAIGGGVRVQLFEGTPPLNVGMGYPLNAKKRNDVKRFFMTIGGRF